MRDIKILYVDDEQNNLNSFKAAFRRSYDVFTAISAKEALEVLGQNDIHVIIADQRMPELSGVELFKMIQEQNHLATRMLLTGYTDINTLAEAINEGHIFRYITKPWNELELDTAIKNGFEFYKAKIELKNKVEELQKTNDDLNRFIYSISHELRAPLASALGVINLAKLENVNKENKTVAEYWKIIEESCLRLDHNLSSTLQYYKNTRLVSAIEEIDFERLISSLIALHDRANHFVGPVQFITHFNQPLKFYGDAFRIEIILGNLISNAIKYQKPEEPEKKIIIDVEVNNSDAIIVIEDNGRGISIDQHEKVFTQFFRGNYQEGAGLGLFIAKEALEKINGTLTLKSNINEGSVFTVIIPTA
ncbi:MAG: hybrid sensor histidine kinase/response regulator [Sphingobacteriales bacterium]|nr:hybrid sensor histidine kinase/response regulator [Sphingobacteriales bacterium]